MAPSWSEAAVPTVAVRAPGLVTVTVFAVPVLPPLQMSVIGESPALPPTWPRPYMASRVASRL